jgi:hypothetical protein
MYRNRFKANNIKYTKTERWRYTRRLVQVETSSFIKIISKMAEAADRPQVSVLA